jgi:hypothetical protein
MPHKPWKPFLFCLGPTLVLVLASVTSFTLAQDSNAPATLQPYATPILHSFLDSANVYPESVTVGEPLKRSGRLRFGESQGDR